MRFYLLTSDLTYKEISRNDINTLLTKYKRITLYPIHPKLYIPYIISQYLPFSKRIITFLKKISERRYGKCLTITIS